MIRAILILGALLICGSAHAADQAIQPLQIVAGKVQQTSPLNVRSLSPAVSCAYAQDDTAKLRAALETGGAAAGKTLFIPSGCKILLGSPGAGDSVADLASNTTIECEDGTAGFVLARKSCSDASETPGAACTADNQCKSGTCDPDYPAGDSFAPSSGSTYTVFGAAAGTTNIAIKNCGIWVNGGSGDSPAMGGAGKRWGYCDGTGTSTAGEGCFNACNSSSGAFEGFMCLTNADCGAGSCTARAGNCKANGGACTSVPYGTNWGASGAGKINPIAWGNASYARVESVAVYDNRRGDANIELGDYGSIVNSSTIAETLNANQAAGQLFGPTGYSVSSCGGTCTCSATSACFAANVAKGIMAGNTTDIIRSYGSGWTAGLHARGGNHVTDSFGGGYGDPAQSGWLGNTSLLISGAGVIASGLIGGSTAARPLYCVLPEFGSGYNFIVSDAYCDGNIGPKYIVSGAGNQYAGFRGAWHGRGAIVGLGDQRGICGGGTRSGKVCLFGAGDDSTIGCPTGATCAANDSFPVGSANHFVIGAGALLHSQMGSAVAFIRTPDSKRCMGSTSPKYGGPCSVDADCTTGSCDFPTWVNATIDGSLFYGGSGATAIDISTSAVGVSKDSDSPSILNWLVSGVNAPSFATGIKFPAISRVCTGGSNDGTSCSADATCTGGGKCRGQVENFFATGSLAGTTTPLVNWDASYGDVYGLFGLLTTDDQPKGPVLLSAGEALTRGQLVSASTAADNTVVKTTTANPERAVGVVLADTLSGYPARILTQGVAVCIADGTISRGDLLKPSGSTAGRVVSVSGSSDLIVGSALAAATSGNTFDCLIGVTPPIQNTTASFPKFASGQTGSTTGSALCSSAALLTSITHTATSGRTIRLQGYIPLDITGAVTRVFTTFITRGGSSCTAGSPTTLVTADSEITSQQNITAAIAYTDTGQSGSVTYRLCFCSDTAASAQAGTGASLLLTEY